VNELPRLRPIAIKERRAVLFLQYGQLDVVDGAFVLIDASGVRVHVPVGATG
jgi:CRISP-associated protein Cas1